MEVIGKVFSCEGNQYRFEKQLQVKKKKKKKASTLPRKTLNVQQQKDTATTGKAGEAGKRTKQ